MPSDAAATLAALLRERRSVRDFRPDPVPPEVLAAILDDAVQAPSWSNVQPYRVGVATGALRDRLASEYGAFFDAGAPPAGDFNTRMTYPEELLPRRWATGFGLYAHLGIDRHDKEGRQRQMRRNFDFFGAPAALFLFVHRALGEYGVLDGGILLADLMLSAQARGLATCAQGALATWSAPARRAFDVPEDYRLLCGLALGYASADRVNAYDPGRRPVSELLIAPRSGPEGG